MTAVRPVSHSTPGTVRLALARLNALAANNPGMRPVVNFYQHLIPILDRLGQTLPPLNLDFDRLRRKRLAGVPLLVGEPLEFDPRDVERIFIAICEVIRKSGDAEQAIHPILKAVHTRVLDLIPLLTIIQNHQAGPETTAAYPQTADRLGLDPSILALAAQNTFKVFLRRWRADLEPQVDLDEWRRPQCPICGAEPGLAEIRGVESARYLRCLRCGAGWPYPNLVCAYCGSEDHRQLSLLMLDERPGSPYLHLCQHCGRGIKTIVTYEAIPVDSLIVEDLATLPLDYLEIPPYPV